MDQREGPGWITEGGPRWTIERVLGGSQRGS